jgi:hypothetical protein
MNAIIPNSLRAVFISLALFSVFSTAIASDEFERVFLSEHAGKYEVVAPGVYSIKGARGEKHVYSFGLDGIQHEIAKIELALGSSKTGDDREEARVERRQYLLNQARRIESSNIPGASKGTIVNSCAGLYLYMMSGSHSSGSTSAHLQALAEPVVGAGNMEGYVQAVAHSDFQEFSASRSATELRFLDTSVSRDCGGSACRYWEAYISFSAPLCGFTSYNPSGNL